MKKEKEVEMKKEKEVEMKEEVTEFVMLFQAPLMEKGWDCILTMDVHPTKPWIVTTWQISGDVQIWNYRVKKQYCTFPRKVRVKGKCAKFVARKSWVVAGFPDGSIRVYNYDSKETITEFDAHKRCITCVVVHPTLPYVLSSANDKLIKLWDWDKGWVSTQIFVGHSSYIKQVTFNPKDPSTFASASIDGTIKIWNLGSSNPDFTLVTNTRGVDCVDYCTRDDGPYLITGSCRDQLVQVWDYETKVCVHTMKGHVAVGRVVATIFHPELPIIVTGSADGMVSYWNSITYRLEYTHKYTGRIGCIGYIKGFARVAIICGGWMVVVKLGPDREIPVASMDKLGNIQQATHNQIRRAHITADSKFPDTPVYGSSFLSTVYPQYMKHNPDGSWIVIGGDGECVIWKSWTWEYLSVYNALEFVWSRDGEYAIRESTSKIRIFGKNFREKTRGTSFYGERIFGGTLLAICSNKFVCFFDWDKGRFIGKIDVQVKNLIWSDVDNGDLVAITSDTTFFIFKYRCENENENENGAFELLHEINERVTTCIWVYHFFIYVNSAWRLNCCVGDEVTTLVYLDRPKYLLGFVAARSSVYLTDKEFDVKGCVLPLSLMNYKRLVMRGDFEKAKAILPNIPKMHRHSVACFLESKGKIEDALRVATKPDHRFDLAIKLGKLEIAKEIAISEDQSESKWKRLGESAMSAGKFEMAEECLNKAEDVSGLLLLYSSIGDAEGISRLATLAQQKGQNNVAFQCLFMLGKVEDCLKLLVECNRVPEAALMARSYLPSRVSETLEIWRRDSSKINPNAAESLQSIVCLESSSFGPIKRSTRQSTLQNM